MLEDAQRRLKARFTGISNDRRELSYPVYALEHGCQPEELNALKVAASGSIRYASPSPAHWLVWTALGAEAGYGYSGDEYWPALERRSGEWRSNEFRQTLRDFYRRFEREFNGPKPIGRWADHFSIIAWPIAHSILPRYLQAHFARHLFDLRHELAQLARGGGTQIGNLLFKRYGGTSSRFRDFLQQTGLTSQIVLALRDVDLGGNGMRIKPEVLQRIVSDLEERPDARTYLRDARKLIQSTGIMISSRLQAAASTLPEIAGTKVAALQRVRLAARRLGGGEFAIGIRLPDFRAILKEEGLSQARIADQRIRFAGEGERLLPASNLLTLSGQERKLNLFPDADASFIVPENSSHALAKLIGPVTRLEERPAWVLRRQADGLFREVLGGHVRARYDYLILCRRALARDILLDSGLTPVYLDVAGVAGYRLKAPDRLTEVFRAKLKSIGVGTMIGIAIEPIGLNPAPGSELPTWLTTEPVMLRVTADYDATAFSMSVDGQSPTTVVCERGEVLLELKLEPGRHRVSVAVPSSTSNRIATLMEQFEFSILAPGPWAEGMRDRSGFRLVLEPSNADFEALIGRRATIQVIGPSSRTIYWQLQTFDAAGQLAVSANIGSTKVGDYPSAVQSMFERLRTARSDHIDEAYQVDIVADLEELGRQALRFPRVVDPLRWKFDPRSVCVRLIDETDHMGPLVVRRYALDEPLLKIDVDTEGAIAGFRLAAPGALLTARYKGMTASLFVSVPPAARVTDFAELGVRQRFALPEHIGAAAITLIDSLRRWSKAKPVGLLARLRRDITVEGLRRELTALCCGSGFATLVASPEVDFQRLQAEVGGSQGFGFRMRTYDWPVDENEAVASFVEFARMYQVEDQPQLARHALTMAYGPLMLRLDNIEGKVEYLGRLLANRTLLRGAFLARAVALKCLTICLRESA